MEETPEPGSGLAWATDADLSKLTAREAELVRQAGERVFSLARDLAVAQREVARLQQESKLAQDTAETLRASRDALSARVAELEQRLLEQERALHSPLYHLGTQLEGAWRRIRPRR
jgi:chromosome segregation ATPase